MAEAEGGHWSSFLRRCGAFIWSPNGMQSLKLNAASRELQEFVISEFPRNLKHNCKILESLCITWQILGIHISGFLFKAWLRLKAAIGVLSSDTVAYSSSPTMASSDSQRTLSLTLNAVSRELDTVNHQSRARIIQMSRSLGCPRWHCRPLAHRAGMTYIPIKLQSCPVVMSTIITVWSRVGRLGRCGMAHLTQTCRGFPAQFA